MSCHFIVDRDYCKLDFAYRSCKFSKVNVFLQVSSIHYIKHKCNESPLSVVWYKGNNLLIFMNKDVLNFGQNNFYWVKRTLLLRIFPLQLLGCIRLAVLSLGGSAGCASGGHPPPGFYSLGGVIAWRLSSPKKGNADGVEGIFALAGRVWASALQLDPP